MKWKTCILSLICVLIATPQALADNLDQWWVRNDTYINGIVYANKTFVAVAGGDNGTILSSPDGAKWTQRWSKAGHYLYGVAYGNNTFVAVGWAGAVLTSPDGITWTENSNWTDHGFLAVVYGKNTFVAVGWPEIILTSPDGIAWTPRWHGTDATLWGVGYGANTNNSFVAVGDSGTILSSPDGIKWTKRVSGTSENLFAATYGNDTFVVVGDDGEILISPDGTAWDAVPSGVSASLWGITYRNKTFVAVGEPATIITSPDGKTWTERSPGDTCNGLYAVAGDPRNFVAAGDFGTILQSGPEIPVTVPGPPTVGTAGAGNAQATVNFTPPASNGGRVITSYTVTSSPGGITAQGTESPITVTGLTNWTAYTFTVTATNTVGTGTASSPSKSVTPVAPTVPGVATLVSPSGSISTNTPTYAWNAVPNSTRYWLWVDGPSGTLINTWYSASAAGCPSGAATCSVTPDISISGASKWWVRSWNPNGEGPWSEAMIFTAPGPSAPGKASLISPSESAGTNTPIYTWNAAPNASYYYLWVDDSTGNKIKRWYTRDQAGCPFGTDICSICPGSALAPGAGTWWIQTWNSVGYGPWSTGMGFTIEVESVAKE